MARKKTERPKLTSYMIQLDPAIFEMHLSFPSEYEGPTSKLLLPYDLFHLTTAGTLCASSSSKVILGIPVKIAMKTSKDNVCKIYFSARKTEASLHFFIQRERFFSICDNIKDEALKFIELAGEDIVRSSAAIGSIYFLTSLESGS